ncbi:type II toxin-antitoxin system Phd/YefM family antitoxin [Patescibacteria group bacterium]|nr:type II toxin-antitoxin system Phd/YefM family antitoxin [Patescibacteria group bacterium]
MPHSIINSASVRDLQRDYRSIIDLAKQTHDAVVLINKSVPEAVILDIETYNALAEDTYPVDEAYALKLVKEAQRSCTTGKLKQLKSWDELDS